MGNIEYREQQAVENALKANRVPSINKTDNWDAIKKFYKLPDEKQIDSVLFEIVLPDKWTIKLDNNDPYKRCCIIYDHENNEIGGIFLKDTGYDYYGYTTFNEDRLLELGIITKSHL